MQSTTASTPNESVQGYLKFLVVGEPSVGKTSFVRRWAHDTFTPDYKATIGVDFASKSVNWSERDVVKVQLWDIAGQERFANMTRHYYREAVGAFIVFDKAKPRSFFYSPNGSGTGAGHAWKKDIDSKVTLHDGSKIPIVLLCNKCDLPGNDPLTEQETLRRYARENEYAGCFFVSAKEGIGIDDAIKHLIKEVFDRDPEAAKRTLKKEEAVSLTPQSGKEANQDDCKC